MRHRKREEKLSRNYGARRALKKSLLRSLVVCEKITTTQAKAKALTRWSDKLITLAKDDSLHHRRLSYRVLEDHALVKRLFEVIAPRFKDISGGYTRAIGLGYRKGDGARMARVELTKLEEKGRKTKDKGSKKTDTESKAASPAAKGKGKSKKKGLISGIKKRLGKKRGEQR